MNNATTPMSTREAAYALAPLLSAFRRTPAKPVATETVVKRKTTASDESLEYPWRNVSTTKEWIVLYNPVSIDSITATNLIIHPRAEPLAAEVKLRAVPYDRFNELKLDKLDPGMILAVGVEISVHDLGEIIDRKIPFVGTCYRDSYSHYSQKELDRVRKKHPHFWLLFPENAVEFQGTHLVYSSNTAVGVVRRWLFADTKHLVSNQAVNDFGKYWHFAEDDEDQKVTANRRHQVIRMTKELHAVSVTVDTALMNSTHAFDVVFSSTDTSDIRASYFERQRIIRLALKTTLQKPVFGKAGEQVHIATAAVPEAMFREACEAVLQTGNVFVGYEDTATHRIWRIFARKQSDRHWIAKWLKPLECWSEGSVYCAVTAKPQMNMH